DARGLMIDGDGPAERALRRRALLQDLDVVTSFDGRLLRILSMPGSEGDAALDRADNLLLELGPAEVGVVIGPAGALCERLRGDAERLRAKMLRPGHLIAAVRLPRGMWRGGPPLGPRPWICAGDRTTGRPLIGDLRALP